MSTVKQFIKRKNPVFSGLRLKSISLQEKPCPTIHSQPSFFGTAFNILFDYTLYKRNLIEKYRPKNPKNNPYINDISMIIEQKILPKATLDYKDLWYLTQGENFFRSGEIFVSDKSGEMNNLDRDMDLMRTRTK